MRVWELSLIQELHEWRNPAFDFFFTLWNFFDTLWFFSLLLPAFCFFLNWRFGFRAAALFLASALVNTLLKAYFATPRPYYLDPSLSVIQGIRGYGFPSGAAQTAVLLSALWLKFGPRSHRVLACLFFFFLSFSRIYLGVHFFSDILGGWLVGGILWFAYIKGMDPLCSFLKKKTFLWHLVLGFAFCFLLFTIPIERLHYRLFPQAVGIAAALILGYAARKPLDNFSFGFSRILGYFITIIGLFLLVYARQYWGDYAMLFGMLHGFWVVFGAFGLSCFLSSLKEKVFG